MKKSMILGLFITLVASFLMLGGIVRAEDVQQPTVSVDKNSQVRKGDVITVTVGTVENEMGIYFNMEFERDAFEIVDVKGYNEKNEEVRLSGKNNHYTVSNYSSSFDKKNNTSISKVQYKFTASITSDKIQNVKVQLKAKKDITRDTVINITEIAKTAVASPQYKGSGSVTIKALVIEPEPETPQETPSTTTPENPTTTPNTTPEPAKPTEKDDTPKTGSIDVALVASMISAITLAGVVAVKRYSK